MGEERGVRLVFEIVTCSSRNGSDTYISFVVEIGYFGWKSEPFFEFDLRVSGYNFFEGRGGSG